MHKEYIRSNEIDKEYGKLYDRLFEDRQESDYEPMSDFTGEDVNNSLPQVGDFVTLITEMLNRE